MFTFIKEYKIFIILTVILYLFFAVFSWFVDGVASSKEGSDFLGSIPILLYFFLLSIIVIFIDSNIQIICDKMKYSFITRMLIQLFNIVAFGILGFMLMRLIIETFFCDISKDRYCAGGFDLDFIGITFTSFMCLLIIRSIYNKIAK